MAALAAVFVVNILTELVDGKEERKAILKERSFIILKIAGEYEGKDWLVFGVYLLC